MYDFEKIRDSVRKRFTKDLQLKLIVILGLGGMALILISQFMGTKKSAEIDKSSAQFVASDYAAALENRITEIISDMDGVGEARVMITLENAGETVYAQEEKRNTDKQQDAGEAETVGKVYQKENIEQKYIIIDGQNGNREALVKTRLEPRIQGVVVVCEGAENIKVAQNITHVVTTALNIPTTRVCVVKISK